MHPLRMTQGLRMLLLLHHLKYYASAIVEGRQLKDRIRCSYRPGQMSHSCKWPPGSERCYHKPMTKFIFTILISARLGYIN